MGGGVGGGAEDFVSASAGDFDLEVVGVGRGELLEVLDSLFFVYACGIAGEYFEGIVVLAVVVVGILVLSCFCGM